MKEKIFALCMIFLILISSVSFAATQLDTTETIYPKDDTNHYICTEVWEYYVQRDGTLTSGKPREDLSNTILAPHNYNEEGICIDCGYEKDVAFEAVFTRKFISFKTDFLFSSLDLSFGFLVFCPGVVVSKCAHSPTVFPSGSSGGRRSSS